MDEKGDVGRVIDINFNIETIQESHYSGMMNIYVIKPQNVERQDKKSRNYYILLMVT